MSYEVNEEKQTKPKNVLLFIPLCLSIYFVIYFANSDTAQEDSIEELFTNKSKIYLYIFHKNEIHHFIIFSRICNLAKSLWLFYELISSMCEAVNYRIKRTYLCVSLGRDDLVSTNICLFFLSITYTPQYKKKSLGTNLIKYWKFFKWKFVSIANGRQSTIC